MSDIKLSYEANSMYGPVHVTLKLFAGTGTIVSKAQPDRPGFAQMHAVIGYDKMMLHLYKI